MNVSPVTVLALVAAAVFAALYFAARAQVEARARQLYEAWRTEGEALIRRDAVERSRSVTIGKVTEHLTPWLSDFPWNPRDARFLGSPVDLVVFDGCDDDDLRSIVFVEIKTSRSALSARQRQIRDAVRQGRVEWREIRIPVLS